MRTISSIMDEHCCCSSYAAAAASSSSSFRPPTLIKPDYVCEFGYPPPGVKTSSPLAYNMVHNSPGKSYSRFGNDADLDDDECSTAQETGWDGGHFGDKEIKRPFMIRWNSGKKVDQRLMMLLESFYQEIYVKRQEFFQKIFPGMQDEFSGVFCKIGAMLCKNNNEVKNRTLQRSLSVGSPRRRPQRFKVKIPAVVIALHGQAGGGENMQPASGSKK